MVEKKVCCGYEGQHSQGQLEESRLNMANSLTWAIVDWEKREGGVRQTKRDPGDQETVWPKQLRFYRDQTPTCGEGAEDTHIGSTSPCPSQYLGILLPTACATPEPSQATFEDLESVERRPLPST